MYRQAEAYASSKSSISIKLEIAIDAIRQYELLVIKLDSLKHQNKCKKHVNTTIILLIIAQLKRKEKC